ncbi:hypothetical protein EYR36_009971 [Pleurotus pulmonarius]|nr:hypothetical protein EYR36_009971 [Pleurotus pulmonarius]KAF4593449.1 hypothetical protein EYR38_009163 [Pleurotus pulmonarius]
MEPPPTATGTKSGTCVGVDEDPDAADDVAVDEGAEEEEDVEVVDVEEDDVLEAEIVEAVLEEVEVDEAVALPLLRPTPMFSTTPFGPSMLGSATPLLPVSRLRIPPTYAPERATAPGTAGESAFVADTEKAMPWNESDSRRETDRGDRGGGGVARQDRSERRRRSVEIRTGQGGSAGERDVEGEGKEGSANGEPKRGRSVCVGTEVSSLPGYKCREDGNMLMAEVATEGGIGKETDVVLVGVMGDAHGVASFDEEALANCGSSASNEVKSEKHWNGGEMKGSQDGHTQAKRRRFEILRFLDTDGAIT